MLKEFYEKNEVPKDDRIPLEKDILLVVPDKDFDAAPVAVSLGLSPFETAVTWPKTTVQMLPEICAASPKFVLQVGKCPYPKKFPWTHSAEWAWKFRDRAVAATADSYVGLHHHDEFSIKDALGTVSQLTKLLIAQRRSFCSVTNHGSVGGWIRQYNACKKVGIKAVFGMEAYISNYRGDDPEMKRKCRSAGHLVLIARNKKGFDNIIRIHNDAWISGFYYSPRTTWWSCRRWGAGIVATTACMGGEIPRALMRDDWEQAERIYRCYADAFDEVYVELQIIEYERQKEVNRKLIQFARKVGAPLIMACDCLHPDSKVIMSDGSFKPIKDIKVGDLVATDDGRFSEVEAIGQRRLRVGEKAYKVISGTKYQAIIATEDHPFLVSSECGKREWVHAKDLKKGDWLVVPRPVQTGKIDSLLTSQYFEKKQTCHLKEGRWVSTRTDKICFVPEELGIDSEMCWVLGMYIAEGYRGGYNTGFGLHEDEKKYRRRIIEFFRRFGFNPNEAEQKGKGLQVRITSFGFASMFEELCGKGCENKHLPNFWRSLDNNRLSSLLEGIFCGDGTWNGRRLSLTTTSECLAHQVQQALLRLGYWGGIQRIPPRMDERTGNLSRPQYVISIGGPQTKQLKWSCVGEQIHRRDAWFHRVEEDAVLVRVKSLEEVLRSVVPDVHDIQVKGRHCFVSEGRLVHNSHYLEAEHADTHDVLMCIRQYKTVFDLGEPTDDEKAGGEKADVWAFDVRNLFYRNAAQMRKVFKGGYVHRSRDGVTTQRGPFEDDVFTAEVFKEALANTRLVAVEAEEINLDSAIQLPKLYDNAPEMLRNKVNRGLTNRGIGVRKDAQIYLDRVNYEFDVICKLGWADYFLIMDRIVSDAKDKFGEWAVGYGRGCFHPSTRVVMSNGVSRFIGNIRKGDVVVADDGSYLGVLDTFSYDVDEDLVEIETDDGRVIRCTKDHKWLVKSEDGSTKWVQAKNLNEDDELVDVV